MTTGSNPTGRPELGGTWYKAEDAPPCADKYPAVVSFAPGTYRGTRGAGQGFVWWDAGTYHVEDGTRLQLSVATDELVEYEIQLAGDVLAIIDPDGCRFTYHRVAPSG
jgi:hypothetical protein